MKFNLKFPVNQIRQIADRYSYQSMENDLIELKGIIRERPYLTKDDLQKVAYWKAPRSSGYVEKNDGKYVEEITRFSFTAKTERARIEILTTLDGVSFPTASVILHLFHPDPYPIIDFRALWQHSRRKNFEYD